MTVRRDADRVREIANSAYKNCDDAVGVMSFLAAGNTPEAVQTFAPLPRALGTPRSNLALIRAAYVRRMRQHERPWLSPTVKSLTVEGLTQFMRTMGGVRLRQSVSCFGLVAGKANRGAAASLLSLPWLRRRR